MRPNNHKQLVAELRQFEKYVERELLAEVLGVQAAIRKLQAVLVKCPDTQFYYRDMEDAIQSTNQNLSKIMEVMDSTFQCFMVGANMVRNHEAMENQKAEMKREADDEQQELDV
jgi:hypothetical protein